jgi:hypothetical protein
MRFFLDLADRTRPCGMTAPAGEDPQRCGGGPRRFSVAERRESAGGQVGGCHGQQKFRRRSGHGQRSTPPRKRCRGGRDHLEASWVEGADASLSRVPWSLTATAPGSRAMMSQTDGVVMGER